MNATEIIKAARWDGVEITLSPVGDIRASGEKAVVDRWRSILVEHKAVIVHHLEGEQDKAREALSTNPMQAMGYGCGWCGNKVYTAITDGWRCDGCGAVFEVIGGSQGPRPLTEVTQ